MHSNDYIKGNYTATYIIYADVDLVGGKDFGLLDRALDLSCPSLYATTPYSDGSSTLVTYVNRYWCGSRKELKMEGGRGGGGRGRERKDGREGKGRMEEEEGEKGRKGGVGVRRRREEGEGGGGRRRE